MHSKLYTHQWKDLYCDTDDQWHTRTDLRFFVTCTVLLRCHRCTGRSVIKTKTFVCSLITSFLLKPVIYFVLCWKSFGFLCQNDRPFKKGNCPISNFLSQVSYDSLVLQGLRCEWGAGVLNLVLSLSLSHTGHWKFNMAHHGKEFSEDLKNWIVALHKDGVGYKKIAKTLKLSCSTVAKTIQRFNRTRSTQNRPRHGRPKKLSASAQRHIQRLCLGNRRMSAASIAAEVEGVGGGGQPVSAQTIRRTLHQIGLHGCHPRRKPLLKMMHKKACKQLLKTSRPRTWITGTKSCGLMRPR